MPQVSCDLGITSAGEHGRRFEWTGEKLGWTLLMRRLFRRSRGVHDALKILKTTMYGDAPRGCEDSEDGFRAWCEVFRVGIKHASSRSTPVPGHTGRWTRTASEPSTWMPIAPYGSVVAAYSMNLRKHLTKACLTNGAWVWYPPALWAVSEGRKNGWTRRNHRSGVDDGGSGAPEERQPRATVAGSSPGPQRHSGETADRCPVARPGGAVRPVADGVCARRALAAGRHLGPVTGPRPNQIGCGRRGHLGGEHRP